MLKKSLSITLVLVLFIICVFFLAPHDKRYRVLEVKTPTHLVLENGEFTLDGLDCFDTEFTKHNKELAKKLNITESEAFILGNLGKYQFENLLKNRKVYTKNNDDLVYFKYGYRDKFFYSGYCLKDGEPCSKDAFEYQLKNIRRAKYKVLDLDTEFVFDIEDSKVRNLKNYILIRKSHLLKKEKTIFSLPKPSHILTKGDIKIYFSDLTTKLKPDRKCSSDICKEILANINRAESTIDMAIYGYSKVPEIETALLNAQNRGVKIRMVYDLDSKGGNIYEDTPAIVKLIPQNMSDLTSAESGSIMHNKFYIFDNKVVVTGSANLSHTDMSGYNSNCIVVINSSEAANVYKQEFEQMFAGKFHSAKGVIVNNTKYGIYFSPQDKSITNAVLPLIRSAKKYIYIPTFVLTDKRVAEELINAKKRGVDVKIIIDALNASGKYSKHQLLRNNGVLVKTENYAGKMHSKSMIVDDEYVLIGSMNFSYSGENKNDENLIVIKDSDIAKFYKTFFLYQWSRIDNKWLKFNVRAEGKASIGSCEDGIDNNYDGLTDLDDPACK